MEENPVEYTDTIPEFQPSDLIDYGKIDEVTKAGGNTSVQDGANSYS